MNPQVWISPCLDGIAGAHVCREMLGSMCACHIDAILMCKFIASLQGFACNEGTKHCLLVLQVLY